MPNQSRPRSFDPHESNAQRDSRHDPNVESERRDDGSRDARDPDGFAARESGADRGVEGPPDETAERNTRARESDDRP